MNEERWKAYKAFLERHNFTNTPERRTAFNAGWRSLGHLVIKNEAERVRITA